MRDDPGRAARVAARVAVGAATAAAALTFGYASGAIALLSRCGENIPPERLDRCNWLEEDGWWQFMLFAAGTAIGGAGLAAWLRSPHVLVLAGLLAMLIAVVGPFAAAP